MCGIAGIFQKQGLDRDAARALKCMTDKLAPRGPDSEGSWIDRERGIALGHRRLSVIDLSNAGAQPMISQSGRFVLTYNGEIYNFDKIRACLEDEGVSDWRGHSDGEILLEAIAQWGLVPALKRCKGMFAIGLWDRKLETLSLARDAVGEKPLYVGRVGLDILFASELSAIACHPDWQGEIDHDAVALLVRNGNIPAPYSLWRSVRKVMPGTVVTLSSQDDDPETAPCDIFWDMFEEARLSREHRFDGSPEQAIDRLDELLRASVSRQMISDVPLGTFLSGGIDSSVIAALAQDMSSRPIQSFSLGFHEPDMNEAPFAKEIADHLQLEHHEIYCSGETARDLVADIPLISDEPLVTSSQFPTYLLSRFARKSVTVTLSGDAGDELFGGYNRYTKARALWSGNANSKFRYYAELLGIKALDGALLSPINFLGIDTIGGRNVRTSRMQLHRRRDTLAARRPIDGYDSLFTSLSSIEDLVPSAHVPTEPLLDKIATVSGWSVLEQVSFLDMMRYLPDDILVKLDRAAMAVSLETRIPMLDPDVIRFAFSLTDEIKLTGGQPKGVLKGLLSRYVPRRLWDRPKKGFGVPTQEWLRGPLKPLADDLFSRDALIRTGVLEPNLTISFWHEFQRNPRIRSKIIWTLFMTQLFLDRVTGRRLMQTA